MGNGWKEKVTHVQQSEREGVMEQTHQSPPSLLLAPRLSIHTSVILAREFDVI